MGEMGIAGVALTDSLREELTELSSELPTDPGKGTRLQAWEPEHRF